MKNIVIDKFDDIGAAITNNETNILLDARQNSNRQSGNRQNNDTPKQNDDSEIDDNLDASDDNEEKIE